MSATIDGVEPVPTMIPGGTLDTVGPVEDLNEPLVISLAEPIVWEGGTLTNVIVNEPTAAQIALWANLKGTEAQMMAVSVCAGLPVTVIQKLKARPFLRAVRRVEAFLD